MKIAEGAAKAQILHAEAESTQIRQVGDATASRTLAIGNAEAEVIKKKTESMDKENFASVEIARALAGSGMKLVPDIIAGGSSSGGTLVDVLLGNIVRDNIHAPAAKKNGSGEKSLTNPI